MKKFLSVLLAMVLIVAMVPLSAGAAEIVDSGTFSGLNWEIVDGTLTISGNGPLEVDWRNEKYPPWYLFNNSVHTSVVKKVVISPGVTSIGDCAFRYLSDLTEVSISETVESIGLQAFEDCTSLESISIPNSVTSIGFAAFGSCSNLKNIDLPSGITEIPGSLFWDCISLESIVIPEGVTYMGDSVFSGCSNLSNVSIPNTVTRMENLTFWNCKSLQSVTLPPWLELYGVHMFLGCSSLTEIKIADGDAPHMQSIDGVIYDIYGNNLELVPPGKTGDLTIPETLIVINTSSLYFSEKLTSITFLNPDITIVKSEEYDTIVESIWEHKPIIRGYEGSTAQEYAEYAGLTFESLGTAPTPDPEPTPDPDPTPTPDPEPTPSTSPSPSTSPEPSTEPTPAPKPVFSDVKATDWYYTPVQWAVENGITAGTSDTTFSPNQNCTREQAVTFLWNAQGQPEPQSTSSPFTDVKPSDYFYKAVLWAAENNVTAGVGSNQFGAGQTCTRAQIVTLLHNYAGKPTVSGSTAFTDIADGAYYSEAVQWAKQTNVTAGTGNNQFSPGNDCTRGQIVTFLYNYMA